MAISRETDGSNIVIYANTFLYKSNSTIKSWRIYGDQELVVNHHIHSAASYADDSSLIVTNIEFNEYNVNNLKSILANNFDSFLDMPYSITITYTNKSQTNYVIDYLYTNGDAITNAGYTIIVQNGVITHIRNHSEALQTSISTCLSLASEVFITQEIINLAYAQAADEVKNQNIDYQIISQEGEKFYDVITGIYYYRVMTTYKTSGETYGAINTLYQLS